MLINENVNPDKILDEYGFEVPPEAHEDVFEAFDIPQVLVPANPGVGVFVPPRATTFVRGKLSRRS